MVEVHTLSSVSSKYNKASRVFKALLYNTRRERTLHQHNLIGEIHVDILNTCRPKQAAHSSSLTTLALSDLEVHPEPV